MRAGRLAVQKAIAMLRTAMRPRSRAPGVPRLALCRKVGLRGFDRPRRTEGRTLRQGRRRGTPSTCERDGSPSKARAGGRDFRNAFHIRAQNGQVDEGGTAVINKVIGKIVRIVTGEPKKKARRPPRRPGNPAPSNANSRATRDPVTGQRLPGWDEED
jgi:hypothetical protein